MQNDLKLSTVHSASEAIGSCVVAPSTEDASLLAQRDGSTDSPNDCLSPNVPDAVPNRLVHRSQYSTVGGLISTIVHSVLIICAGLFFMTVQQPAQVEIQFSVADQASSSVDELSIEVDLPMDSEDAAPAVSAMASSTMSVVEPELLAEFGELAAAHNESIATGAMQDSTQSSKATDTTSSQKSNDGSGNKGSFFGTKAYGDEFVYVVDMSTSMGASSQYGQSRFRVACGELLRSIRNLSPNQKFCVFMFSYRTRVMFDSQPSMISATNANKQRIARWINQLGLGAGTDPRYGTMMALRLKPDAIFLLSDGEFNGRDMNTHGIRGNPPIERLLEKYRKDAVPIHTIAFEDMLNRKRLRRIATGTDGTHRFVGQVSQQDLLLDDLRSNHPADVAFGLRSILDGSQKLYDERHFKRAVALVANQFKSRDSAMRALALETMLALAEGKNLGPASAEASHREFVAARKEWMEYWKQHFNSETTRAISGPTLKSRL